MTTIRLLAFSDWRVQRIEDILECAAGLEEPVDFILYAGDDVGRFADEGTNYFTELSKYARQKRVLAVIGNDDDHSVKEVLDSKNILDLHEKPFVFKGFAFIGLEGSTSGPAIVKYTEREVKEHLEEQHKRVKGKKIVVISHTPPHGILDRGIRFAAIDEGSHNIGSTSLREFVQKKKAHLVVCGHCHSHGGLSAKLKNATVANVASHDSPGSKGKYAVIEVGEKRVDIEWHDTFETLKKDSLMFLHNVGNQREKRLNDLGINSIKEFAQIKNLEEIARKSSFSPNFLRKLQLKAKSVVENKVFQISPFRLPKKLVFFDIETDIACERVWLVGVLKNGKFKKYYADNWRQEKKILKDFMNFLEENPDCTLVSYSGTCFDNNVMQRALRRLKIDNSLFDHGHVDLCQMLKRSYVFPNQSYALKELGKFLGYPFKHSNMNGLLVALEYQSHVNQKKRINPRVFEYNEDDVRALPYIIDKITKGIKIEKQFLSKAAETRIESEVPDEMKEEIMLLRKLKSEGYTLQELAEKFGKSVYYIYSRLCAKYRPDRGYKALETKISKKEMIQMVRESYEEFGRLSIRKDKRYNCYSVEVRFYARKLTDLSPLRKAMSILGFNEGSPYVYSRKRRCYVTYCGKEQAISFVNLIRPRKKNDISKLV